MRPRLALTTAAALSLLQADASAFCRTTTARVPADYQPAEQGCWTQGLPLYWKNACVGYSIQKDTSRQISYDQAAAAITRAFTRWTGTTCSTAGNGPSRVSVDVRDLGRVDCNQVQYNDAGPNQHVIIFRDDLWPYSDSSNTLALTTVTFNPDTGEIYDADMEINSHDETLTAWDPNNPNAPISADGYDFLSIVTHETGHFLGMAHSADAHATMYAHYTQGSTAMRELTVDDIGGICTIYPPDGTRSVSTKASPSGTLPEDACDPTPRHGFTTACIAPAKSGCSVAYPAPSGRTGETRIGLVAIGACAMLAGWRRRRTKKTWRGSDVDAKRLDSACRLPGGRQRGGAARRMLEQ